MPQRDQIASEEPRLALRPEAHASCTNGSEQTAHLPETHSLEILMPVLDYAAFDADNHYYEALDAFTRHVPKAMQPRCVQWAEIEGRKHHLVGGKLARAVRNPTWNPIAKPGAIADFLRGNPNDRDPSTLTAMNNLASNLHDRDYLEDACVGPRMLSNSHRVACCAA